MGEWFTDIEIHKFITLAKKNEDYNSVILFEIAAQLEGIKKQLEKMSR